MVYLAGSYWNSSGGCGSVSSLEATLTQLEQLAGAMLIDVMLVKTRPQRDWYLFPGSGDEFHHRQFKGMHARAQPLAAALFVSPAIIRTTRTPRVKDCAQGIRPFWIEINPKTIH
jgi:hypothetical protein